MEEAPAASFSLRLFARNGRSEMVRFEIYTEEGYYSTAFERPADVIGPIGLEAYALRKLHRYAPLGYAIATRDGVELGRYGMLPDGRRRRRDKRFG